MACNPFIRIFQRWRRRLPFNGTTASTSPLPDSTLLNQKQLTVADLVQQDDVNFLLLGCLPGQGSYTLKLPNVPLTLNTSDFKDLQHYVNHLPGVLDVVCQNHPDTCDLLVNFSTAEDAAMAFVTHPIVNLGHGVHRNFQYAEPFDPTNSRLDAELEPARKKIKIADNLQGTPVVPRCHICYEDLDGTFARPCLLCKKVWCYGCIKNNFEATLTDLDRFPARCCGRVVHYDVARTVVSTEQHDKYKTRFEEFSTTKPVYCANMRCSIFLPSRISQPDEQGHIRCPDCDTLTCEDCRAIVEKEDEHDCVEDSEEDTLLAKFDYKHCPRCNTAVARMFGCSHMRCQCGAHFCWDCLRSIHMCWANPCAQSRADDGYRVEDYGEYGDLIVPQAEVAETGPTNPPVSTDPAVQSNTNVTEVAQTITIDVPVNAELQSQTSVPGPSLTAALTMVGLSENAIVREPFTDAAEDTTEPVQLTTEVLPSAQPAQIEESTDHSDLPEPATRAIEPTISQTPLGTPPDTSMTEPAINLDSAYGNDWEASQFDFGDEPYDETWDVWGCYHIFQVVAVSNHKQWLPITTCQISARLERHVDCMRCFKTIVFDEKTEVQKEHENTESIKTSPTPVDTQEPQVQDTTTLATTNDDQVPNQTSINKKTKKQRRSRLPKLYSCQKCGVFHCTACKNIVLAELQDRYESQEAR